MLRLGRVGPIMLSFCDDFVDFFSFFKFPLDCLTCVMLLMESNVF